MLCHTALRARGWELGTGSVCGADVFLTGDPCVSSTGIVQDIPSLQPRAGFGRCAVRSAGGSPQCKAAPSKPSIPQHALPGHWAVLTPGLHFYEGKNSHCSFRIPVFASGKSSSQTCSTEPSMWKRLELSWGEILGFVFTERWNF